MIPEASVPLQPPCRLAERMDIEGAQLRPPLSGPADQARMFENPEVPGDCRERDIERFCEFPGGTRSLSDAFEDGAARGIRESRKDAVECVRMIVNHMVKYNTSWSHCQEQNFTGGQGRLPLLSNPWCPDRDMPQRLPEVCLFKHPRADPDRFSKNGWILRPLFASLENRASPANEELVQRQRSRAAFSTER